MDVEVDQSGIIGKTSIPTVLAFSNHVSRAILIPGKVKRDCLRLLRQRGLTGKEIYFRLFAAGLFCLLTHELPKIACIFIDVEFVGREAEITRYLLSQIHRINRGFTSDRIRFRWIGKSSRAHKKAIETFRGHLAPDRVVTTSELLRLIK